MKYLKLIQLLLVCTIFSSCINKIEKLSYKKSRNRLIKSISTKYSGIVIEKFSPREKMYPTHFVLSSNDTLCPSNSEVMNIIKIGDSILKDSSDNYIYVYSKSGIVKKTWFMKIPNKYRKDSVFPLRWKGKWLDSSEKKNN
jgi:hypothetical protein|tara:strand:- start:1072 stop:1494 length:423 start_codon:yes stop_codon:yes gene_type:complete